MLEVAIVSANPETLDGLSSYFDAAGLRARCVRTLADCSRSKPTTKAFVFFPDDYRVENVVATIGELAVDRPAALRVLVTSDPKSYAELAERAQTVIVPRPAWASAILDAVRAHFDAPKETP